MTKFEITIVCQDQLAALYRAVGMVMRRRLTLLGLDYQVIHPGQASLKIMVEAGEAEAKKLAQQLEKIIEVDKAEARGVDNN